MKILRANAPQQTIDEVDESLSKPDFGANWHPSYVAPSAVRVSATVVGGARSLIPTLVNRDPLASLPNQKAAGHTQFETDDPRAICNTPTPVATLGRPCAPLQRIVWGLGYWVSSPEI